MKFFTFLIYLVLTTTAQSQIQKEARTLTYYEQYQPLADSLEEAYGIPSSIMLAVAMQESGGGKSRNAKLLNNHHGIVGKNNLMKTHGIKSMYRYFETPSDSYVCFCNVVANKKFYNKLKGTTDYAVWVKAIANSGYAGSNGPKWIVAINGIIKRNNLH